MFNNLFMVTYKGKQHLIEAMTNNDLRRKIKKKLGLDRIPADCRISTTLIQPANQEAPKGAEEVKKIKQHVDLQNPTKFMDHDVEVTVGENILLLGQEQAEENGMYRFNGEGQSLERVTQ